VLTQDCTNKDEFSSQENTLFKKMAKTGIRHIAEKSADIIDPVQNKKNKKDSKIRKRTNRIFEIRKKKENRKYKNRGSGLLPSNMYLIVEQ
jgi:hypothetical protein